MLAQPASRREAAAVAATEMRLKFMNAPIRVQAVNQNTIWLSRRSRRALIGFLRICAWKDRFVFNVDLQLSIDRCVEEAQLGLFT